MGVASDVGHPAVWNSETPNDELDAVQPVYVSRRRYRCRHRRLTIHPNISARFVIIIIIIIIIII